MIWPSLNPVNGWNTLKPVRHNVTGNGDRDGLKSDRMEQWAISRQAPRKLGEGSTTKESSL